MQNLKLKFKQNSDNVLSILLGGEKEKAFPGFIIKGKGKTVFTDFRAYLTRDFVENETDNYYVLLLRILKKIYNQDVMNAWFEEKIEEYQAINPNCDKLSKLSLFNYTEQMNRVRMLELVNKAGRIFAHLEDTYKSDSAIALTAIKRCPRMIRHVSISLLSDDSFIKEAYSENQDIRKFLTDKLQNKLQKLLDEKALS